MTVRLYEADAYLRDFDTTVVDMHENWIALASTTFRPDGEGQPHDIGTITGPFVAFGVRQIRVDNDTIWHQIRASPAATRGLHKVQARAPARGDAISPDGGAPRTLADELVNVGDEVHGQVNWYHRYVHMRAYTALRLAREVLASEWSHEIIAGRVAGPWGYIDLDCSDLPRGFRQSLETAINSHIAADHRIVVRPEGSDRARTVEVEGMASRRDYGLHVGSTGEVGTVKVLREWRRSSNRRIRIKVLA